MLYLVQLAGGLTVHFLKPRLWALGRGRRPVQNYVHAVFGLLIIAFAMMQVRVVSCAVRSSSRSFEKAKALRGWMPEGLGVQLTSRPFSVGPHGLPH